MRLILSLFVLPVSVQAVTFSQFVDPNPADGNQFGSIVLPLSTGNVVITAPGDDAGGQNAGAVYLFNGGTGALISTLRGSTAEDAIGSEVVALGNGNFVVCSPMWDNGTLENAGAVTWASGSTGISGSVSATNSLSGSAALQRLGSQSCITLLTNGHYVVNSPAWSNGSATYTGAVIWCDGTVPTTGPMTADNSLVGSAAGDGVGGGKWGSDLGSGVIALPGGNYVVVSPTWNGGNGAVTWGNGSTGTKGVVSATNSLVGTTGGSVGSHGVTILANGNYVVSSPHWYKGSTANVGAATWGSAATGVKGAVSASNSLIGGKVNDHVSIDGITTLTNGNYVVISTEWGMGNNTLTRGAVTWGNGTTGVKGAVAATNSLVGSITGDSVGSSGVAALTNGNYVVGSPNWKGLIGAATWGNGSTGIKGTISASNSMTGIQNYDGTGSRVKALSNGHYVVVSAGFINNGVRGVGAVTWGNGSTGTKGAISAAGSLIGTTQDDNVGVNDITPLANGNYVVCSQYWDNGSTIDAGAVTWRSGSGPHPGVVDASNSLIGPHQFDEVGRRGSVVPLPQGDYIVLSSEWRRNGVSYTGAATWGSGTAGVNGLISPENSLVGGQYGDNVGMAPAIILPNGNYLIPSKRGVTLGQGTSGVRGEISAANSFMGNLSIIEHVGNILTLPNNNYVAVTGAGNSFTACTLISAANPHGTTLDHSTTFTRPFTGYSFPYRHDEHHSFYFASPGDGSGKVLVGDQTTGFSTSKLAVARADSSPLSSGTTIDFGEAPPSPAMVMPITLKNTSSTAASLAIFEATVTGPDRYNFRMEVAPASMIEAGQSSTLQIHFSADNSKTYNATLTLTTNDPDQPTFSLNLTGHGFSQARFGYNGFVAGAGYSGDNAAFDATPQKDGVSNLLKFAFNLVPHWPDTRRLTPWSGTGYADTTGLPLYSIVEKDGQTWFQVEYGRLRYGGITYTAKWSDSLNPGSFVPMNGVKTVVPSFGDRDRVIERVAIDPATRSRLFGIVEVTLP
jgi:hypothetical protein